MVADDKCGASQFIQEDRLLDRYNFFRDWNRKRIWTITKKFWLGNENIFTMLL